MKAPDNGAVAEWPRGAEIRAECEAIGWSLARFGEIVGVRHTTVQRWVSGRQGMPPDIAVWLRLLAAFHRDNPPPAVPRRNYPTELGPRQPKDAAL
jgi:transcriptional regulator with XRE-family HTH domain